MSIIEPINNGGEVEAVESGDDFLPMDKAYEHISKKIVYTLGLYPKLSHSMLQVGIGTGLPPAIWRPILEQMIKEGQVLETKVSARSPAGRDQVHEILQLPMQGATTPLSPEAENADRLDGANARVIA